MIIRVWHGWTTLANASAYRDLLLTEVFPRIAARRIPGYLGIKLDAREQADHVVFATTMGFESLEAVRAFGGADYEHSVVPESARRLLDGSSARPVLLRTLEQQRVADVATMR
jgi:hypothetical protein